MRREPTDAERKMWSILRGARLCTFKFRRQHPLAGYILDFYCPAKRLSVELDGGQHADPRQSRYDHERTETLARIGVRVLRFWDNDVLKYPDSVAKRIYEELIAPQT